MADTKLADLTALTAPAGTDLLYAVADPAGTPVDRKMALDNLFTRGTVTADSPVINAAQTWNNAAVTFTAAKLNVTDTASSASSLLMDLQVGGSSKFQVDKNGARFSTLVAIVGNFNPIRVGHPTANPITLVGSGSVQIGLNATSVIGWGVFSSTTDTSNDLFIGRRAAANLRLGAADTSASATITVTIAAPGVVTWSSHGLSTGSPVIFTTTGALPTGITAGTTYYAIVVNGNTFQLASSFANALAGTAITTSGSQSGTHTGRRGAIAQTFGVQDTLSTSSLENIDGADLVIRGSHSIGNKPGGSIVFQVAPAGSSGTAQNALATALTVAPYTTPTIVVGSDEGAGAIQVSNDHLLFGRRVAPALGIPKAFNAEEGIVKVGSSGAFGWAATTNVSNGASDVRLYRDAANTLALRNGANAQTFRVYNTTDGTNSEFGKIAWSSNVLQIGTEKAGTGTARALAFYTDGNLRMTITEFGRVKFDTASPIEFNAASIIQLGGTTSSFPALKRSSATLQVRLATDTDFAPVQGKLTTDTAYAAGAPTATGYLVLYDSNGTAYKVPAVAV